MRLVESALEMLRTAPVDRLSRRRVAEAARTRRQAAGERWVRAAHSLMSWCRESRSTS
jgi:hypothetical protein